MMSATDNIPQPAVRLGFGDPGKQKSRYAVLVADILPTEIRIRGAKEWSRFNYTEVADDIAAMHGKHNFRRFGIELNNTGQHVQDYFVRFHPDFPLWPVNTVGRPVTDPDKIREGKSMYKQGTAEWVKQLKEDGVLKFPKDTTPALEELKRQMEGFLPHPTETGRISYHTEGMQRDDLVMCLLGLCYIATPFIKGSLRPVVVSGKEGEEYWAALKSKEQNVFEKVFRGRLDGMRAMPGWQITDVQVDGQSVEFEEQQ